ncbi:MAG: enoyl-CoA hydratase/isomerase family protein [Peptococcaceae bacterium]|nr:enoyl-CoA hydratase/isomerase family protein [Peptococcaceae bacterium]
MSFNNIIVEVEGFTGLVTINRPKVLNALNLETLKELEEAVTGLEVNPEVRAIIITGAGDKAFVAGADISFMQSLTPLQARGFARTGQKVLSQIENLSKPVIAAVNGFALGGGCELAMACDIRVASEKARFGQPEVNLGIMAGFGGTQRLTRLVNPGIAKEMLFTGDMYDAQAALRMGLVNHVVPAGELMDFCKAMAGRIAAKGPVAVRLSKEAVNQGLEMDLEKALALEADLFAVSFTTADRVEGISAFLNKTKPNFKGE